MCVFPALWVSMHCLPSVRRHGAACERCGTARVLCRRLTAKYTVCALLEFAGGRSLNLEMLAFLHFRVGRTLNSSSSSVPF